MVTARKSVKEHQCNSISEFTAKVEKLLSGAATSPIGNWYRGIGSTTYSLTPSLFRHPSKNKIEDLMKLEATMLQDFERSSVLHAEKISSIDPDGRMRSLFIMQHYGVPTRLLDWTPNPFISLYFALTTAKISSGAYADDAAVWVLNPVAWNKVALKATDHGDRGPLVHSDALEGYAPRVYLSGGFEPTAIPSLQESPACLYGITNNARMFAQRGVFTIFGKSTASMEDQFSDGGFGTSDLVKIVIPAKSIESMLSMLLRLGYTDSVTYPDLAGLAMEIKRSRGFGV